VEIKLSSADYQLLMRPVAGSGGWQSLLRKLQKQVEDKTLTITESDSQRILRYILSYGSGGWQDRLAGIAGQSTKRSTAKKTRASRKR
jgi:hypothetical protein